jgi:hypothetical protein
VTCLMIYFNLLIVIFKNRLTDLKMALTLLVTVLINKFILFYFITMIYFVILLFYLSFFLFS